MELPTETLEQLDHRMRDIVRSLEEVARRVKNVREMVGQDYEHGSHGNMHAVLKELDTIVEML